MHRLSLQRFNNITSILKTKWPAEHRSLFVSNIQLQEGLIEKPNVKTEPINIDRPQTDNLLLSPEKNTLKKQEKPDTELTQNKDFQINEINIQSSDVKNINSLTKPNITDQLQDSLIWAPSEQVALTTTSTKMEHAISFEEIPGPLSLKIVSNLMKYIPVIGMQTVSSLLQGVNHLVLSYGNNVIFSQNIKPFNLLFDTYGDVVCLRIPFCGDIVMVQKPEHISEIYKQRNSQSISLCSFDSLSEWHKRQTKRRFDVSDRIWDTFTYQCANYVVFKDIIDENFEHLFSKSGLSLTQDIKDIFKENYEAKNLFWSNSKYHATIEKTSEDFIKRIFAIRSVHDEVSQEFHNELYVWSIECMMQTLFGTNIGFYQVSEVQTNDAQRMLQAFLDASEALQNCESGFQMWRFFNTRSWDRLSHSCEILESILAKHIRMSKLRLDIALKMMIDNKNLKESARIIKSSLVKALILSGCIQPEQILSLCLDMMLVGVNAASISLGFIFYHLSKSPKAQMQLFNELKQVLPEKNSTLQLEHLRETPFLHACITESLRLKHPIPYSTMCLPKNIVINKYCVPAGTYVLTANEISCLKEDNFEDAIRFKPERWLNKANSSLHDAVIPLSEGTRSFLGRDWLHQQLAVATAKVIRNFVVGYNYGEIKTNRKILSQPNKPFKFTFTERSS